MLTSNSETKVRNTPQSGRAFSGAAVRLCEDIYAAAQKLSTRVRDTEAAELLEFALALPLILVMVVGLLDFAHAYNIKQKLANAAREGARLGGSEITSDLTNANCSGIAMPCSVVAIRDDVTTYLRDSGVDMKFLTGTTDNWDSTNFVATFLKNGYGLKIERYVQVSVTETTGPTTVPSTRVTLSYPYDWTFGFNKIIKLLLPSSTFSNPISINADAMMANPS